MVASDIDRGHGALNDKKKRYSAFALARNAASYHQDWQRAWRKASPKASYDAVIIGGGGHGLATAYYLASVHGMKNIAVIEKGWIGGGNTGRNTTIIRSNYLWDESASIYEHALKLWEGLAQDLNFNIMVSQRGSLQLAHDEGQWSSLSRLANRMRVNGIDAQMISRDELSRLVPILDCSDEARFPVLGAMRQGRGGTARHDAVAWGYARAADRLGVDIIQNCEVQAMEIVNNRVVALNTSRGRIGAGTVGMAVAGHSSHVAAMAGLTTLVEQGTIDRSDRIVVPITGSGFKDLATPDRLTPQVQLIPPETAALKKALENYD